MRQKRAVTKERKMARVIKKQQGRDSAVAKGSMTPHSN